MKKSMKIKILGSESLGVRGLSCVVETHDRKIVIDPGLALGYQRHKLLPHPFQVAVGKKVRREIVKALKGCTDIVISHFHGDHIPLANANPYQLSARKVSHLFQKPQLWCKSPYDVSPAMAKRCSDLSNVLGRRLTGSEGHTDGLLSFSQSMPHGEANTHDKIFISHDHWDHVGGLSDFLKVNKNAHIYVPGSSKFPKIDVIPITKPIEIQDNVFSTGELQQIEQSLAVKTERGTVLIVGCSHPGVGNILKAAFQFGRSYALIGGMHGFREFDLVKDLEMICPCHCTQYKSEIKKLYPDKSVDGGAAKVIEV